MGTYAEEVLPVPIVPVTKIFWYKLFSGMFIRFFEELNPMFRFNSLLLFLAIFVFDFAFLKNIFEKMELKIIKIRKQIIKNE